MSSIYACTPGSSQMDGQLQTTFNDELSPLSDEKMDTGSESFLSSQQGSSPSDCEDKDGGVSAEPPVLRLANPIPCENMGRDEQGAGRENIRNQYSPNPPILISTLTLTEDHPLMSYSSPDSPPSARNFPDLILHSCKANGRNKIDITDSFNSDFCELTNSLFGGEDECFNRNALGGDMCSLYGDGFSPHNGPQRNTSKNNLYFSDNLISPDSGKSIDGDEPRNYGSVVDIKPFVKSNVQPDIVDSGRKYSSASDTYFSQSVVSQYHFDKGFQHDTVEGYVAVSKQKKYNLNMQNATVTLNTQDDTVEDGVHQQSQLTGMRRNSWSNSGSSVDSLCDDSAQGSQDEDSHNNVSNDDRSKRKNCDNVICEKIPEYSLDDERSDSRKWLKVILPSGERRSVDMKVIEPYKRVLSHGGYALSGRRDAIVVFSACFLPDSGRVDYNYVMDNLFLYVLTTMEQLVTDDYILIYLHGSASKRSMPTFHWLKKCYQLIDRRLRKSLKHLYLVHPTFWLKSIVFMTRPFISSKFFSKLTYVHSLDELSNLVPVEYAAIPERVRRFDLSRS